MSENLCLTCDYLRYAGITGWNDWDPSLFNIWWSFWMASGLLQEKQKMKIFDDSGKFCWQPLHIMIRSFVYCHLSFFQETPNSHSDRICLFCFFLSSKIFMVSCIWLELLYLLVFSPTKSSFLQQALSALAIIYLSYVNFSPW